MTTLPEEAVKAALEQLHIIDMTIYDNYTKGQEAMVRRALTAALPFLPVQGAVKKLEWNEYNDEQGIPDRWDAEASSFGVFYSIEIQHDGYRVVFDHEAVGAVGVFPTLEAAKAAAQADYSSRILSALEPYAGRAAVLEEAAEAVEALKGRSRSPQVLQGFGDARREAAAAIRALASHLVADKPDEAGAHGDGWLPIESAPKDGTSILAVCAGVHERTGIPFIPEVVEWTQYGWSNEMWGEQPNHGIYSPTHWRHLPSAPSEGAE